MLGNCALKLKGVDEVTFNPARSREIWSVAPALGGDRWTAGGGGARARARGAAAGGGTRRGAISSSSLSESSESSSRLSEIPAQEIMTRALQGQVKIQQFESYLLIPLPLLPLP